MDVNTRPETSLAQQVGELKAELEAAQVALAEAEQNAGWQAENARSVAEDMQHFVYAVSHDLRQPLRGVLTGAQLLERDPALPDHARESTGAIIEGAREMNSLIERLLTYSRVASNLRRTIVPLTPVVQWSLMSMSSLIEETKATIRYDSLPVVDVDDSVLSMLFQELFSNSIRYCESDRTPQIDVISKEAEGGFVISVRDNACGVSPEFLEKVFVPFQRLQNKDKPGYGLGLSICRKIVRAHGGNIWMESDGMNGSTVSFQIPS